MGKSGSIGFTKGQSAKFRSFRVAWRRETLKNYYFIKQNYNILINIRKAKLSSHRPVVLIFEFRNIP